MNDKNFSNLFYDDNHHFREYENVDMDNDMDKYNSSFDETNISSSKYQIPNNKQKTHKMSNLTKNLNDSHHSQFSSYSSVLSSPGDNEQEQRKKEKLKTKKLKECTNLLYTSEISNKNITKDINIGNNTKPKKLKKLPKAQSSEHTISSHASNISNLDDANIKNENIKDNKKMSKNTLKKVINDDNIVVSTDHTNPLDISGSPTEAVNILMSLPTSPYKSNLSNSFFETLTHPSISKPSETKSIPSSQVITCITHNLLFYFNVHIFRPPMWII
jgi:hypothetical protein